MKAKPARPIRREVHDADNGVGVGAKDTPRINVPSGALKSVVKSAEQN